MADFAATYECLRAAGRDPDVLHGKRLLVAGCGNAGSNATLTLAVLGVEAAYVDPDSVEPKNLAHSPFLDVTPRPDGTLPFKAELLARAHVAHSRRPDQVAHWAAAPLQAIPWGVLRTFDGMLVGIDDGPSRAWAARVGALLGIPTIVAGFYPPTGNFVATSNRDADSPCYFCLRPTESTTRASCSLYATAVGTVNPALQTAAAATMNVAIEAMTRFWHDDLRYDGHVFRLDLGEGCGELTSFRRYVDCPGPHERLPEPRPVAFDADAPARAVLDLARADGLRSPELMLPSAYVVSLPCRACGREVPVEQPEWMVRTAPCCGSGCGASGSTAMAHIVETVSPTNPLADRLLRELGLGPLALCVVEDAESGGVRVYELPGNVSDVFHTVTRSER